MVQMCACLGFVGLGLEFAENPHFTGRQICILHVASQQSLNVDHIVK